MTFIKIQNIFFAFVITLSGIQKSSAELPVVLTDSTGKYSIGNKFMYLEDAGGKLTIDSVRTEVYSKRFTQSKDFAPNFGMTHSYYWFWFDLVNRSSTQSYLLFETFNFASIELFIINNSGKVQYKKTGVEIAYKDREVPSNFYVFKIAPPGNDTVRCYLRVYCDRGLQVPAITANLDSFIDTVHNYNFTQGLYFGLILIMACYNFLIWLSIREHMYLYYVLYVLAMAFFNFMLKGFGFEYWYPTTPQLNNYTEIMGALLGIAGILFATEFLHTKEFTPRAHKFFRWLIPFYVASIIIFISGFFTVGLMSIEVLSMLLIGGIAIISVTIIRQGYKPAKFFLLAWTALLLSVIIFIFEDMNVIPYSRFAFNSMQIGSGIEALLLSFALANKINFYKKEKEQTQEEYLKSLEENRKLITEQNITLEKKVKERTEDLTTANSELGHALENLRATQSQLIQSEKLASLGALTAGIAHEIKNPLNFVNNFSDISSELIDEIKSARSEEERNEILSDLKSNLEKITHHGKRADNIVQSMLQHSRSGIAEKNLTDLNRLCDEYMDLSYHGMRANIPDFNSAIKKSLAPGLPQIKIVTQDISRVVLNLLNNAFYAVREKSQQYASRLQGDSLQSEYQPQVSISTLHQSNNLIIKIRDNGNGIPEHLKEKIFEPFFTTKPTGEGTGLGLSICYDIITAHGGEIKVNSRKNEFTEFSIILPL